MPRRIPKGWQEPFLEALRECGHAGKAAAKAGVGRSYAYEQRKRSARFKAKWEAVVQQCHEAVEETLYREAVSGKKIAATIFYLKTRLPDKYSEFQHLKHDMGDVPVNIINQFVKPEDEGIQSGADLVIEDARPSLRDRPTLRPVEKVVSDV